MEKTPASIVLKLVGLSTYLSPLLPGITLRKGDTIRVPQSVAKEIGGGFRFQGDDDHKVYYFGVVKDPAVKPTYDLLTGDTTQDTAPTPAFGFEGHHESSEGAPKTEVEEAAGFFGEEDDRSEVEKALEAAESAEADGEPDGDAEGEADTGETEAPTEEAAPASPAPAARTGQRARRANS